MKVKTITLLLLLFVFLQTICAQNAPLTTIGNAVMSGTTVSVPITVSNISAINNNSIVSCNLKILYNPAIVIATGLTIGSGIGGSINFNISIAGEISLGWYTSTAINPADNSVLFNLNFQKVSSGTSAISFTNSSDCYYYNGSWNVLNASPFSNYFINGSVSVLPATAPHSIAPSLIAIAGNTVNIPIKVTSFNNVGNFTLTLNYNPASLTYVNFINNSGFPGMAVNSSLAGSLVISATSPAASGISYADSSKLISLIFNYAGGTSGLNWIDNGNSCKYTGPLGAPTYIDTMQSVYYINGNITNAVTSIKGQFSYSNASATGINGTIIQLINSSNTVIAACTTALYSDYTIPLNPVNVNGYYEFLNISNGNYKIRAIPSIGWGGVNSTDALIVKRHTVGIISLTALPLKAADVNKSNTINSTDALLMQLRSIGSLAQFNLGDWVYSDSNIVLNGNSVFDFKILAAGDVNQSYSFSSKKQNETVNFEKEGIIYCHINQEINIPVSLSNAISMGALSLEMAYDEKKLEILDINSLLKGITYSLKDGKINIGWSDIHAQQFAANQEFISIKARVKAGISSSSNVFSYSNTAEIADENGNILNCNSLKISSIETDASISTISIYPNPCRENIEINYSLSETANVKLSIYNAAGQKIRQLEDEVKTAGNYSINFTASALKSGLYNCILKVNGTKSSSANNIRFIKTN